MERSLKLTEFVNFLQDELAISSSAITVALRQRRHSDDPLPMLLWQYGLISIEQLQQIFDWLEKQPPFNAYVELLISEITVANPLNGTLLLDFFQSSNPVGL